MTEQPHPTFCRVIERVITSNGSSVVDPVPSAPVVSPVLNNAPAPSAPSTSAPLIAEMDLDNAFTRPKPVVIDLPSAPVVNSSPAPPLVGSLIDDLDRVEKQQAQRRAENYDDLFSTDVQPLPLQLSAMQILNWAFTGPVDQTLPPDQLELEERERAIKLSLDGAFSFLVLVAGAAGKATTPEKMWRAGSVRGGEVIGTLSKSMQGLSKLATDAEAARTGTASALNQVMKQALQPLAAPSTGKPSASVPLTSLTSLPSSTPATGAAAKPPSAVEQMLKLISTQTEASSQSTLKTGTTEPEPLPQWLQDRAQNGMVDNKTMLLWMLTRREAIDATRLKALEMLYAPDTDQTKELESRKALLDYANKLQEFFQKTQDGWVRSPSDIGMVFLTDDVQYALARAHETVMEVSGMTDVPYIDLMTHQYVRVSFARLVAMTLHYTDLLDPRRLNTALTHEEVRHELKMASQRFKGMYYGLGPNHTEQLMLKTVRRPRTIEECRQGQFVDNAEELYSIHTQRRREERESRALQYAQRNGQYYNGRSPSMFDRPTARTNYAQDSHYFQPF